jgi:trimethylamine--corrinoid protein Co-methyltransferase
MTTDPLLPPPIAAEEAPTSERRARRRTGARNRAERANRVGGPVALTAAYLNLCNPIKPVELFSEDQVEAVHDTSMAILEEIGLRVLNDEARGILKAAGAEVDDATLQVRFDRGMVLEAVAKAPSTVRVHARNSLRDVEIGGNRVVFLTVSGPPFVSDLDKGRRDGSLATFTDMMRLAQHFDVIHILGAGPEPVDVPASQRHLDTTLISLTESDKIPFIYSRGREVVTDAMEMIRIGRGIEQDQFDNEPSCFTVVNSNSPLQLDIPMSKGIIDFARHGQLMVMTPFTLAGAMAPISLAGALAQQNAEALAGIALAQIVRPGAPVLYGGFTSNVDMKSGAPAFGTPEYVQAAIISGQLARRYRLPWRSSNVNASNAADAQATYESQMALWGALLGGANFILHGAGWLEGGLTMSFEKFIIDVEMLQMFAHLFQPVPCDSGALAMDAIREVGPAGHYFGAAHTLERYESAFYAPLLSDWRNFETWQERGALDATQRANAIYKRILADFEAPALDPAIREELDEFVARRRAEGGADLDR